MRDQNDRRAESLLHAFNHLENLRLNRYIKGSCWFVGDQHLRVIRNCNSYNDSLPHATRKLVRILSCAVTWLRYTYDVEQFNRSFVSLTSGEILM